MEKVEFYKHAIGTAEQKEILSVLKSIFLTTGDVVKNFEEKFSNYLNIKHTIGVTSCTAALHLCLVGWGIGTGDEVITTPMSFCATANAILHAGAKPVFVDVEADTGNMDITLIEKVITDKTKAVIPVHLYGQMCNMKELKKVADKYNLILIEDAAHAIEADRDGIRPGQISDAACFSFYATKNITSGEGGAISTNNSEKAESLSMLRLHGIDKSAADRYTKYYQHWDMPCLGWKYNMDNIHASLLTGQLERIESLYQKRDKLWNQYVRKFSRIKGIDLIKEYDNSRHARHLFTVLVDPRRRDEILHHMQKKGVGVAVNYRPIHLLKFYRKNYGFQKDDFPKAEKIGERTISLPLYPSLKEEELSYVVTTLKSAVNQV